MRWFSGTILKKGRNNPKRGSPSCGTFPTLRHRILPPGVTGYGRNTACGPALGQAFRRPAPSVLHRRTDSARMPTGAVKGRAAPTGNGQPKIYGPGTPFRVRNPYRRERHSDTGTRADKFSSGGTDKAMLSRSSDSAPRQKNGAVQEAIRAGPRSTKTGSHSLSGPVFLGFFCDFPKYPYLRSVVYNVRTTLTALRIMYGQYNKV